MLKLFYPIDRTVWFPENQRTARTALGLDADALVVAYHGVLDIQIKGLDVLLQAWERVTAQRPDPRLTLLIVGSGKDGDALARLVRRRARRQRQPLGTAADLPAPDQAAGRRREHAGDRRLVLDQRDVDGELVEAGEEFARAVERIDDEKASAQSFDRPVAGGLLRHHGDAGHEPGESRQNDGLRSVVGGRDRRRIRLVALVQV